MGEFVARVRQSTVRQPTQRGFSPEDWTAVLSSVPSPDDADQTLHSAGLWYFAKFEAIRNELSRHSLSSLPQHELIRLMVATLNFMYNTVRHVQMDVAAKGVLVAEELVQARYDGNEFGHAETPDNIITQYLDGARHPLSFAVNRQGEARSQRTTDDDTVIRELKHAMVLGQLYHVIADCWGDTLWHNWYLQHDGDVVIISPPTSIATIEQAVSGYRYHLLLLQDTFWMLDIWQRCLTPAQKTALSERFAVSIVGTGKHKTYRVTKDRTVGEVPALTLTRRLMTQETYYEGFRHDPLEKIGGTTLEQLLDVWELLHAVTLAHVSRFPTPSKVTKPNTLRQYAPLVERRVLCELISNNVEAMTPEMSNAAIDFLCFRGRRGAELWSSPIVPVDVRRLAIVFPAIMAGNLLRACELWLKRAGVELNSKGPLFETHVRLSLLHAMQNSRVLNTFGVLPSRLIIEADGASEEIDCAFWLGNTVLLGEVKCLYLPTEPIECRNYYDNLDHAAAQIRRKATFAQAHVDVLVNRLRLPNVPSAVVPFVLSNQPFGVGFDRDGIPVTDIPSLTCYLEWGCLKHGVVQNVKTGMSPPLSETKFYDTEAEAAARIANYLHCPPHIMAYTKSVRLGQYPWPVLNETDGKTVIRRAEVHFVDDGSFIMTRSATDVV